MVFEWACHPGIHGVREPRAKQNSPVLRLAQRRAYVKTLLGKITATTEIISGPGASFDMRCAT